MNCPNDCSFVIIAGKYLNMVDDVMKKVDQITEDIAHMPEVVFLLLNEDITDVEIDTEVRNNVSPPMVSDLFVLGLDFNKSYIVLGLYFIW